MTVTDACAAAAVARATLIKFEAGDTIRPVIVSRLRAAFEDKGITFGEDGHGIAWRANE